MQIRDVMTQEVVTVPAGASVLQAGELMSRYEISGLPVVDDEGHLVGIVTERDFLRPEKTSGDRPRPRWFEVLAGRSMPPAAPDRFRERRVAEVMTPSPITVGENTPLDEVVRLIELQDIKRLPVMRSDQLVGVISRGDLLRALVQSIHNGAGAMKESKAARARLTELERQSWLHRTRL